MKKFRKNIFLFSDLIDDLKSTTDLSEETYKEVRKAIDKELEKPQLLPKKFSREAYTKANTMTYDNFLYWWDSVK